METCSFLLAWRDWVHSINKPTLGFVKLEKQHSSSPQP